MGCHDCGKPAIPPERPVVIGWRCWYTGYRRFCSRCTTPEALPKDGLLYRKIYFNRPRPDGEPEGRLDSGADLYFFYRDVYGYTNRSNDNPVDIAQRYQGAIMVLGKWGSEPEMAWAAREAQTMSWHDGD